MMATHALRQTWTTVLTQMADQVGARQKVNQRYPNAVNASLAEVAIPSEGTHHYVPMDQGIIAARYEKPLYSEQFGSCLAILARAFKANETAVSYTSLSHIYLTPQKFNATLEELVNKIEKSGVVEIFISGGTRVSRDDFKEIQGIISAGVKKFPTVSFVQKSSLFGIADHTYYICDSRKQLSPKGESFIVRKRQHAGGLHHQLAYRQIGQASKGFDLHSSHCVVGYHS